MGTQQQKKKKKLCRRRRSAHVASGPTALGQFLLEDLVIWWSFSGPRLDVAFSANHLFGLTRTSSSSGSEMLTRLFSPFHGFCTSFCYWMSLPGCSVPPSPARHSIWLDISRLIWPDLNDQSLASTYRSSALFPRIRTRHNGRHLSRLI